MEVNNGLLEDMTWIDLNARDEQGNSALILAVLSNRSQAVQAIAHKAISRNRFHEIYSAKNLNGDTALTLALSLRHWECVRALEKAKHLNRRNSLQKRTDLLKRAQSANRVSMFATKHTKNRFSLNNSIDSQMADEAKTLMNSDTVSTPSSGSNSNMQEIVELPTKEADTQDVQPRFDEEKKEEVVTKERANTTPAHYLQWLSKPKMIIDQGKQQQQNANDKISTRMTRKYSDVIANALDANNSNPRPSKIHHMGKSATDIIGGTSDSKGNTRCEDDPVPFWKPPEYTDMATPQASMLMSLRERLRSIVVSKPKKELYPSQSQTEGLRSCKSYTDVNEGEGHGEMAKKTSLEKLATSIVSNARSAEGGIGHPIPTTSSTPSNQINFHDLSGSNLPPVSSSGGHPLAIGSKLLFRSRAKSEAHKRERIYKKRAGE